MQKKTTSAVHCYSWCLGKTRNGLFNKILPVLWLFFYLQFLLHGNDTSYIPLLHFIFQWSLISPHSSSAFWIIPHGIWRVLSHVVKMYSLFIHIIIPTAFSQLLLPITKTKADKDVFMRGEMGGRRDGKRIGKQTTQIVLNICIDSVARICFLVKFHWEPPFFSASFLPLLYTIVSHPLLLTLQKQLCRGEDKLQFNFFLLFCQNFSHFIHFGSFVVVGIGHEALRSP